MLDPLLQSAVAAVPSGNWAVAVSGGADSVALLTLLVARADLSLHVVHLDHQTRGEESAGDAEFVRGLSARLSLPVSIARRDQVEPGTNGLPINPSARYRAIRFELFREIVRRHGLAGVILAHHADDQAETVLHRLIRGASAMGLAGMCERTSIGGLLVLRPLLGVCRATLRDYLLSIQQPWREDSSNVSSKYLRNRLRPMIASDPELRRALLDLGEACRDLRGWARAVAPRLPDEFPAARLANLPDLLARQSARRWLIDRGVPLRQISNQTIEKLVEMANDAASAARVQFPGGLLVRRRGGIVFADYRSRLNSGGSSG